MVTPGGNEYIHAAAFSRSRRVAKTGFLRCYLLVTVGACLADARQDLLGYPVLEILGSRLVTPHDELVEA